MRNYKTLLEKKSNWGSLGEGGLVCRPVAEESEAGFPSLVTSRLCDCQPSRASFALLNGTAD